VPVWYEGQEELIHKQSQTSRLRYRIVTEVLLALYVRPLDCDLKGNRKKWGKLLNTSQPTLGVNPR
jgi:hypothetical protein